MQAKKHKEGRLTHFSFFDVINHQRYQISYFTLRLPARYIVLKV